MGNSPKNKVIALVGMAGAGKTEVAREFMNIGYDYIRLGQITLDEVKRRGLEPNEKNERPIREELRAKHGMGAFAILNFPKIDKILETTNAIVDGLYSWSEYKEFKKKYGNDFKVIAINASPETRYSRLENRAAKHGDDPDMVFRSFGREEAKSRDYAEIEKVEKGGPIAMADFTIVNEGALEELRTATQEIINKINES
ncbi:AAA family ATPase [Candidatus Saccharibacteria bacterium]|nr:AAA family ATPase [Candidatus Saccharibacteria bacterium]NIV03415.1 AAA family ATPase [Calditrichia bacterium]NIS37959.1 AAA family ATPase [Candidatus Saccharibacteria bacterium]NIV71628.1 AAA family ATPase [Calditrichia bacterium]NIV98247.1 AAA family ATPase [Candidatus Saccharibacteria bacterium]